MCVPVPVYVCMLMYACAMVRYGQLLETQIQTLLKDKSEETRASARFAYCTSVFHHSFIERTEFLVDVHTEFGQLVDALTSLLFEFCFLSASG